ncbi:hypothetical protein Fmac_008437 [Flemingia macrophylla]|uniref:Uncharacterized protein n=1 Tax=Flemingia macrophylla TaxID=520843 RepID=A0ABD1MXD3_9FABA
MMKVVDGFSSLYPTSFFMFGQRFGAYAPSCGVKINPPNVDEMLNLGLESHAVLC